MKADVKVEMDQNDESKMNTKVTIDPTNSKSELGDNNPCAAQKQFLISDIKQIIHWIKLRIDKISQKLITYS